jgi:hypothetical protein
MKNPDKLFELMRAQTPPVSFEKMESFVAAQVTAGVITTAKMGLFKKLLFKFHLNSIFAMTTIGISATIISALVYFTAINTTQAENSPVSKNTPQQLDINSTSVIGASTQPAAIDSPKVAAATTTEKQKTVFVVSSSDSVTVVKKDTANGSAIMIVSSDPNLDYTIVNADEEDPVAAYSYSTGEGSSSGGGHKLGHLGHLGRLAPLATSLDCCDNDTMQTAIENELLKQGLIKAKDNYSFEFTGKYVKVNGEKQSEAVWQKFKTIIEQNSSYKVNKKFQYFISVNKENSNTSISTDE